MSDTKSLLPMSGTQSLTLAQKLVSVYKTVDHIEKRGVNQSQNYNYVRASDLAHAVRNALLELGVYAQVIFSTERAYNFTTKSGANMNAVDVRCDILFVDSENPDSPPYRTSGLGSGSDSTDKAIFKAQTGALKYALRNAFLVPDATDPEDSTEPEPAPKAKTTGTSSAPKTSQPAAKPPKAELPPAGTPSSQDQSVASSGPAGEVPSKEEDAALRKSFVTLVNELAAAGLAAGKGLPVQRKVLAYLLQVTGAEAAEKITRGQWASFFSVVNAVKSSEKGVAELVGLVNAANSQEAK